MNWVDVHAASWRAVVSGMGKDVAFRPYQTDVDVTLRAFMRGATAEELFGAALQWDTLVVIRADQFMAALPARPRPMKFDRVRTLGAVGQTFTVEDWRSAPAYGDEPVVFKLHCRGGAQ